MQLLPPPVSEIVTLFSDYLTYHRLHHTMSFTAADLLALEQIAATTTKIDEVLYSIEWVFRQQLGGANQNTKTRSARLAEGWYGYWRDLHGVLYTAGFGGYGPGEQPHCFVAAKSWEGLREPTAANVFQQALRQAWGVSHQSLDQLVVTHSLTKFLPPEAEKTPLEAMRNWFKEQFAILNDALAKHPQMLYGNAEPGHAAIAKQAELGEEPNQTSASILPTLPA